MPKRRRSSGSSGSGSSDGAFQPGDGPRINHYGQSADLWAAAALGGTPEGGLVATNLGPTIDLSKLITHQEVFLRILGFLNAADLASVQGVSRYWQSMSLDQQLWKRLYLSRYPHPHHTRLIHTPASAGRDGWTGPAGTATAGRVSYPETSSPSLRSRTFRPISRLPSRAFPPPSPRSTPSRTSSYTHLPTAGQEGPKGDVGPRESFEARGHAETAGETAVDDRGGQEVKKPRLTGKGRAVPFARPALPESLRANESGQDGSDEMGMALRDGVVRGTGEEQEREIGSGVRHEGVDWKMMLRLGTNWTTGSASQSATITLPPSPSPSLASTQTEPLDASASVSLSSGLTPSWDTRASGSGKSQQHLALSPHFIFTSSPLSPLVQVYRARRLQSKDDSEAGGAEEGAAAVAAAATVLHLGIIPPPPGWSNPHRPDNVTAITTDQAIFPADEEHGHDRERGHDRAGSCRLAVFYASGGIVILRVSCSPRPNNQSRLQWTREAVLQPTFRPSSLRRRATAFEPVQGDPVVLAEMFWPVLITCTQAFHVSVYSITNTTTLPTAASTRGQTGEGGAGVGRLTRLRTLHSDVSFHPASLSLFPENSSSNPSSAGIGSGHDNTATTKYKAALTYCTPVYPSSWTVAVQELDIDLSPITSLFHSLSSASAAATTGWVHRASLFHVSRSTITTSSGRDESYFEEDDTYVWPRPIKPIPSVKGTPRSIGSDGRWCVLAGRDGQIEVFALPATPAEAGSVPTSRAVSSSRTRKEVKDDEIAHVHTLRMTVGISALELVAGKCVVAGEDGRVVVWDLDTMAAVGFGSDYPDGGLGLEGTDGRTLGVVEISTGKKPRPAPFLASKSSGLSSALAYSPSQRSLSRRKKRLATMPPVKRSKRRTALDGDHGSTDWEGAAGSSDNEDEAETETEDEEEDKYRLPHPAAISAAARAFFLPLPPAQRQTPTRRSEDEDGEKGRRQVVHHVAFDEEKIVGMMRIRDTTDADGSGRNGMNQGQGAEGMKVWSFA